MDQRWTLSRVALLIEGLFGESYTLTGVAKLLHRLGYSAQRPAHQAVERDEAAVATWRRVGWSEVKEQLRPAAPGSCFLDETGQSLRPPKARTWARRGRTPVIPVCARRSPRVAIVGMVCVHPGYRPRLLYRLRIHRGRRGEPKGVTPADLTGLLRAAHHHLPGKITVVWDNLPAHHATVTRTFVEHHADWLDVAWLPAYAPELNPVESLWAHLKTGALANLAARGLDHLIRVIRTAIKRLQYRPDLLSGFLTGTGLRLEPP